MNESAVEADVDQVPAIPPAPVGDTLSTITSGAELFVHLQAILPGRSALNSGFTFNRVVKVLNVNGLLPADFGQISYGLMKAQQKAQLHNIIKALNQENNGRDLFDKLQDAITNKVEVPAAIRDSDSEGGIVVNRWALMCESDVHSSSCEELTKYFTKLTADERPGVLTDGIGNYKKTAVAELMRICMEEVAPNVRNCFIEEWPALSTIHHENGTFSLSEVFLQLLGEAYVAKEEQTAKTIALNDCVIH